MQRLDDVGPFLPTDVSHFLVELIVAGCDVQEATFPCPYLPGRIAKHVAIAVDKETLDAERYERALERNFRRSQGVLYLPICDGCQECRSLRVEVKRFRFSRNMKRCMTRNQDLAITVEQGHRISLERARLYAAYISGRHLDRPELHDGDLLDEFVCTFGGEDWPFVRSVEYRDCGKLVAVGIFEELPRSLNAVYCYFSPQAAHRSLGTFNVLWLITRAKETGRPFVYLGYYVAGCRKMNYKARYRPCQVRSANGWERWEKDE